MSHGVAPLITESNQSPDLLKPLSTFLTFSVANSAPMSQIRLKLEDEKAKLLPEEWKKFYGKASAMLHGEQKTPRLVTILCYFLAVHGRRFNRAADPYVRKMTQV